jgi:hypothetical protein
MRADKRTMNKHSILTTMIPALLTTISLTGIIAGPADAKTTPPGTSASLVRELHPYGKGAYTGPSLTIKPRAQVFARGIQSTAKPSTTKQHRTTSRSLKLHLRV